MTQEIITALIVITTVLYVVWRVYKNFFSKNRPSNPGCSSCPSVNDCKVKELKTSIDKKKEGCNEPERLP